MKSITNHLTVSGAARQIVIVTIMVLTLTRFECYAQKNFYAGEIQQNGVTKTGFISYNPKVNNKGTISFKEKLTDQPVTLTARDIEGFTIPGFNIKTISVPSLNKHDTLIFAEMVIEGKAVLAVNKNEYVIFLNGKYLNLTIPVKHKDTEAVNATTAKRLIEIKEVGKVKDFLAGCDFPVDLLKLTSTSLSKLVAQYNACQSVPQKKRNLRKLYVEPQVGVTFSHLKMTGESDDFFSHAQFDPSIAVNLGLNFRFTSGSQLDKTIFTLGLIVNQNTFNGTSDLYLPEFDLTHKEKYEIKLTRIKIPMMMKKFTSIAQKGFYYGGGFTPYVIGGFTVKSSFVEVRDGDIIASGSADPSVDHRPFGVMVSLIGGYDLVIGKNKRLLIGCSLDYDPGLLAKSTSYKARVYSYQLNLGVRL